MRLLASCAVVFILASSGCITGRVVEVSTKWRRPSAERLTVTGASVDDDGVPYGVAALEAECRVTPGAPNGDPGARAVLLPRTGKPGPDVERLVQEGNRTLVAAYERASGESLSRGSPEAVVVVEGRDGGGSLLLRTEHGWKEVPARRYLHAERSSGHPVAATTFEAVAVPVAMVADLATFPFQWMLAPWLPLTPP